MTQREPKSMADVHEWRKKLLARAKGKTLRQKMDWISKQAKILGVRSEAGQSLRFKIKK